MSADIISLQEWRRKHCEHHQHETMPVSFPFILPTWPSGRLLPMLVEIAVSMIAAFGASNRKNFVLKLIPTKFPRKANLSDAVLTS